MASFTLSGFSDEISPDLGAQIKGLQALDIQFFEPRNIDGKNIADFTVAQAKELKSRLDGEGIAVSAIGSPIGKIGIDEPFGPHLSKFKNLLDVTRELGCGAIRMFSFFIPQGQDPSLYKNAVIERLGNMALSNEGSGIALYHENEKAIYGDVPARCLDIVNALPGKIFLTYDPSNFVQCGVDNKAAFALLLPHIRYMHMKDSVYEAGAEKRDMGFEGVSDAHRPVGLGDGQVEHILQGLIQADYQGFLSIEPHLSANDAFGKTGFDKFKTATDALRALLKKVGA